MPISIKWVGCAISNFRIGRPTPYKPEAIVIHLMDGTLTGTGAWFGNPKAIVSAHYGVGKKGEVHQYVQERDTAFHAGRVESPSWKGMRKAAIGNFVNPNYYTIGIEHEGVVGDRWTEEQVEASAELIARIAGRWKIPVDADHVVGHRQIYAAKACPGPDAPMEELIRRAGLRLTPQTLP